MPQRAFENGYIDGWTWVRGNDQIPAIPPYKSSGLMPYQAGVFQGARDACISASTHNLVPDSDPAQYWVDQFLSRKPISWRGKERRRREAMTGGRSMTM
jgi:hypothetical protein